MSELNEPLLEVAVERHGAAARVVLTGELDVSTVDDVKRVAVPLFVDPSVDEVVVDLRGLAFMDSSGVRLLLALELESRRDGHALALIEGAPDVQRVLEITQLARRFRFVDPPAAC